MNKNIEKIKISLSLFSPSRKMALRSRDSLFSSEGFPLFDIKVRAKYFLMKHLCVVCAQRSHPRSKRSTFALAFVSIINREENRGAKERE